MTLQTVKEITLGGRDEELSKFRQMNSHYEGFGEVLASIGIGSGIGVQRDKTTITRCG